MAGYLSRTLPTVQISRGAISANLATLMRHAEQNHIPVQSLFPDVSGDALGCGVELVTQLAQEAGYPGVYLGAKRFSGFATGEGIAMAGTVPTVRVVGAELGFVPAVRLFGQILATKTLRAGEGVSYGYTHRAERDTRIALVTGGYAQGIVRALGNQLQVTIEGNRHRIVGRVAMDVCVVDIGSAQYARGTDVVFLGDPERDEPGIVEWREITGMGAAELIAPLGLRANREIVA